MAKYERTTREELRDIWRGFTYHCSELSRFMVEHGSDPYFKTDEGLEMAGRVLKMTGEHLIGLIALEKPEEKEPEKEEKGKDAESMEDLLKSMLGDI